MAKNIGDLAVDIISSFHSLLGALEESDDGSVRKRLQYKFRDQLARFRVWSGDTGALERGQDSLESRLRDASHIRTQILELLNDLGQSLKDARDIIASFEPSWNGSNDKEEFPVDVDAETEGREIAEDITDLVDGLSRLGCSIHNPAPHDDIVASKVTDAEGFEQQDIQHVRTKFAGIKYYLARRLGKAISRRREYFQYLKTSQPGFRSRGSTNECQFGPDLEPLLTPEQVERIISAGDLSDDDDSDLAMIDDLKSDSLRWEAERQKQRAPGIDWNRDLFAQPAWPNRLLSTKAPRHDASLINDFNNELPNHEVQSSRHVQFSAADTAGLVDLPSDLSIGNGIDLDTVYPASGSADSFTPSSERGIGATHPYMARPSFSSTSGASHSSPSAQSVPHRNVPWARDSWASAAETPAAAASNSDDPDTRAEIPITEMYTQMSHSDW
ncbi:hypothetical protein CSHISOI_01593, partial [Colletotrichum shisoi]